MLTSSYVELIVLASPMANNTYYKKTKNDIIAIQIAYAKKIIKNGDKVLILTNSQLYDQYAHQLGADKVLIFPMQDIWMRDFTLANPVKPIMFHYTAAGQGGGKTDKIQSDDVQDDFYILDKKANLSFKSSNHS